MAEVTTAFLSGVSAEFRGLRLALKQMLEQKDCHVVDQDSFGTDWRSVDAMLRQKIARCDFVIHLAGFRFGHEPQQQADGAQRRSFTQREVDIAVELGKPVYRFVSRHAGVRDPPLASESLESAEQAALQASHRDALMQADRLWYPFGSVAELLHQVASIAPATGLAFREDLQRVMRAAPNGDFVGRDDELALLDAAWSPERGALGTRTQVLSLVALGGEGKSTLVARWMAIQAGRGWPGCGAAFGWSFYSQGTREQSNTSGDLFVREALQFFGGEAAANSALAAHDKGRKLATLVAARRALLVLDGLEPLQYPPSSPLAGQLKDPALAALLHGLAARPFAGLALVTTRIALADLAAFRGRTVQEHALPRLHAEAGVRLLASLQVTGSAVELAATVDEVKGHALTLSFLGAYLRDAHRGDVRRRDRVRWAEADAEELNGHAFRVIDAYTGWLTTDGERGPVALALLRLLGLFDRPVDAAVLGRLLAPPVVVGLNEKLLALDGPHLALLASRLAQAGLVSIVGDANAGPTWQIDAHPLLRAHMAQQLRRSQPRAWAAGHARLYAHLSASVQDADEPTLEDLAPLYEAMVHGCQAGYQRQVCTRLYAARILRWPDSYVTSQLGGFGADLGGIAAFFDVPWTQVSPALTAADQAWLLGLAGQRLRALGRLAEAWEPMCAGHAMRLQQQSWRDAGVAAGNLSELAVVRGDLQAAVAYGRLAVTDANRGDDRYLADGFTRIGLRATLAHALQQAGQFSAAAGLFGEAEALHSDHQPEWPLLYAVPGILFCDALLAPLEILCWRRWLALAVPQDNSLSVQAAERLQTVHRRALRLLQGQRDNEPLLDSALVHGLLGRTSLFQALLDASTPMAYRAQLDHAVAGLRRAGMRDFLPPGLVARAWMRSVEGHAFGADSACEDLDDAWDVAARGPMPLHQADILLTRARLFGARCGGPDQPAYPWQSAAHDLADARRLIEKHGYWRRRQELDDAEAAAARRKPRHRLGGQ